MSLIKTVKAALYHEDFWLPGNVTWKDLESTPDHRYPQGSDLLIPLAIAPLLLLLRYHFAPIRRIVAKALHGQRYRMPLS